MMSVARRLVAGVVPLVLAAWGASAAFAQRARSADSAHAGIVEIVPTSRHEPATWRYTVHRPRAGWKSADFDDTSWKSGPGGFLYIGMGDTGPQGDPQGHGQDLGLPLGKMLRIDVDHVDLGKSYGIPKDNPFVGRPGVRPEIWAYGFREPWRFSFDAVTEDLWVGDVGQDRIEEVDPVRRGENYGRNVYEGFELFSNRYRRQGENFVPPVFAYNRRYGNSITGGYVYRGRQSPSFDGVYICADYTSRRIWGLIQKDRVMQSIRQIATCPQTVSSFAVDEAGELYVVGYDGGTLYHLDLSHCTFDEPTRP